MHRAGQVANSLLVLCFLAVPLCAQTPPPLARTGKAKIIGVVIDSLNGTYLSDADVMLEGASATARTDSLGKFEIDDLAPGNFRVGAFHPVLDTLGITLVTEPFHVGPDSAGVIVLAVPSAETLARQACPRTSGSIGSAVAGQVVDPETLQPIANAEVSVAWAEIAISKSAGIVRTPQLRRAATTADGSFAICDLPNSLDATLQARHGSSATSEIPISLGGRPVEFLARTVLLSSLDSSVRTGSAAISGVVLLEGNSSGAATRIDVEGSDAVAVTDAEGRFTLQNLPSGTRNLTARHLGFGAQVVAVDLSPHAERHVTVKLAKFVSMMDPVLVLARRSAALDKVGFNQRKRSGTGYYLGPDQLRNAHPLHLSDVLRRVPSLRIVYTPQGDAIMSSRGGGSGCVQYFLDDMPYKEMTPGDINSFVGGSEIVAVEVYQAAGTPAQYARMGNACTTIVLWTSFRVR